MGKIVDAINLSIFESQNTQQRSHLGMSIIGEECARKIWYSFRWVLPIAHDPQLLRIFERGKLEETRFVNWLTHAGVTVHQTDPATGQQYRFVGYKGHVGGEIDGVGEGVIESPFLLEFKTSNTQNFRSLELNHVEFAQPVHYVQVQMYMGHMQLPRALYLAIDKNTDKIYDEVIPFHLGTFEKYHRRSIMIVDAAEPPPKISHNPTWYVCRLCDFHSICHKHATPLVNCRTCAHSTPVDNAKWICERYESHPIIPDNVLPKGCDLYEQHPMNDI